MKFLFTEEEYQRADAKALNSAIHYCVMAKVAMSGACIKADANKFSCFGSARGGTRYKAGWDENEFGIGIPFNKFNSVIDGIYQTVNAIEPNHNKAKIEERPKQNKLQ